MSADEMTFFERARPEFERRLSAGEKPEAALKAAAVGVVKRDEALYLALHGVGGGGRDAAEAFKKAISAHVYERLRA